MEFVDTIDYYFDMNKEQAKIIGEIYLDTDNDENTGGEDSYLYAGGFECKLDVWSGVKNNDTETSVSGGGRLTDYTEETDLHYFIQYIPSLYDESENSVSDFPIAFDKGVTSHTQPELVAFNDNFIEFKTPLDHVDIEYRDDRIIRALFSERGSGLGTESFSDEAIRQIFIL
jgi:hypothetical protein